jgi:hypothetical protein
MEESWLPLLNRCKVRRLPTSSPPLYWRCMQVLLIDVLHTASKEKKKKEKVKKFFQLAEKELDKCVRVLFCIQFYNPSDCFCPRDIWNSEFMLSRAQTYRSPRKAKYSVRTYKICESPLCSGFNSKIIRHN